MCFCYFLYYEFILFVIVFIRFHLVLFLVCHFSACMFLV